VGRVLEWEHRFSEWSQRQDGLIAKFQLPDLACTSVEWWRAVRTGRWEPIGRRVLRSVSAPLTDDQRIRAAALDTGPGAMLHGPAALAWLHLAGFDHPVVHVARMRGVSGMASDLAVLHHLRSVRAHHVVVARGLVVQNALRAIWTEAARYASPRRFEIGVKKIGAMLDNAHKNDLVTWAGLHEMVDDIRGRGRGGSRIMAHLATKRLPGTSPTESRLEARVEEVLDEFGVRRLRRQVHLGGREPIGRVDFSDDEVPLWTEANSLIHHTTPTDRAADEHRYKLSTEAGFLVLVLWEDDIWKHPRIVADLVIEGRRRARRGERIVIHSPSCPWPRPRFGEVGP
jgi:very-short-patch-repair endonuclease